MKTLSFFVEANVHAHVDVYFFKSFVKIREYWSTQPYPKILLFSLHMLGNVCNTTVSMKSDCVI